VRFPPNIFLHRICRYLLKIALLRQPTLKQGDCDKLSSECAWLIAVLLKGLTMKDETCPNNLQLARNSSMNSRTHADRLFLIHQFIDGQWRHCVCRFIKPDDHYSAHLSIVHSYHDQTHWWTGIHDHTCNLHLIADLVSFYPGLYRSGLLSRLCASKVS